MSMIRHVPIRWEPDFYRPFGTYDMMQPMQPMQMPFPHVPSRPVANYETQSYSTHGSAQPPMAAPVPMSPHFEHEFKKMTDEMNKMFQNKHKLQPVGSVDDRRHNENFRMDNPVIQDHYGQRRFQLQFDVRQFKPEEIEVKTFGNQLTVHAKHEEKDSGKSAFREYQRQFTLPKEVNPELLSSKLTTEGVLSIEAPLPALDGPKDKMIPIEHRKI